MTATTASRDLAHRLPASLDLDVDRDRDRDRDMDLKRVTRRAPVGAVQISSEGRRVDQIEGAFFALLFGGFALMAGSFAVLYLL